MRFKEILGKEVQKKNLKLGCYSPEMENVNKKYHRSIIDNIGYGYDVPVRIGRKTFIVEMPVVANEQDFVLIPRDEYINSYMLDSNEFREKFPGF